MKQTSVLYECRGCGGVAVSKQLMCPYCDKADGGTVERSCLDGGTEEVTRNWYRIVELVQE